MRAQRADLGDFSYGRVQKDILATLGLPGKRYLAVLALCFGLTVMGAACWVYLVLTGMGASGINNPVGWGSFITTFVFWVGIGHAGTLISAVLFLLRGPWRSVIFRAAVGATILGGARAGLFPLIHVGRIWVIYYTFPPYPNGRDLWPNFRSPLFWDSIAISTYLTVSAIFFYVGLLPDIAAARDRAKNPLSRFVLGLLALGWMGSSRQWKHYGAAYVLFAALATPLVVSVHSVVSWDFAMSVVPGWHTTIFAPYFVAGAILSGLAMVLCILIPLRRVFSVKHLIRMYHLESMAKLIIVTSLVVGYAYGVEFFIAWYAGNPFEEAIFAYRPTGDYALQFWIMVVCNTVIPLAFFWKKVRTSVWALFIIGALINVGMWFERYNIIVTSLSHEFFPHTWGTYSLTWVEWGIFIGSFGWFFMLLLAFFKFLPAISVAEVKESMPHPVRAQHAQPAETGGAS